MRTPTTKPLLDTLLHLDPEAVAVYAKGASELRGHLENSAGMLMEAYRGAAPIGWTACGLADVEISPLQDLEPVAIPLGTYVYQDTASGLLRMSGVTSGAAYRLIAEAFESTTDPEQPIVILDEVQMGSTVTRLTNHVHALLQSHDIKPDITILAAEDTRYKTRRIRNYHNIKDGRLRNTTVKAAPMPLIACDKDNILPTIVYSGSKRQHNEDEDTRLFSIAPQPEAEILFRYFGSLDRKASLQKDTAYAEKLFGTLPTTFGRAEVRQWTQAVLQAFQRSNN